MEDKYLRNENIWTQAEGKILFKFQKWYQEKERIPDYIKKSRVIPISKDKENPLHPPYPKVRTIACMNVITKLWELTLISKIQEHLDDNDILHPH